MSFSEIKVLVFAFEAVEFFKGGIPDIEFVELDVEGLFFFLRIGGSVGWFLEVFFEEGEIPLRSEGVFSEKEPDAFELDAAYSDVAGEQAGQAILQDEGDVACIEEGILQGVFDIDIAQAPLVEEQKAKIADFDFGVELFGEPLGSSPAHVFLNDGELQDEPECRDDAQYPEQAAPQETPDSASLFAALRRANICFLGCVAHEMGLVEILFCVCCAFLVENPLQA